MLCEPKCDCYHRDWDGFTIPHLRKAIKNKMDINFDKAEMLEGNCLCEKKRYYFEEGGGLNSYMTWVLCDCFKDLESDKE